MNRAIGMARSRDGIKCTINVNEVIYSFTKNGLKNEKKRTSFRR